LQLRQPLSIDELRDHVGVAVPKLTDDRQHPTVDRDNIELNAAFPIVAAAASILTREDPLPLPGRVRE